MIKIITYASSNSSLMINSEGLSVLLFRVNDKYIHVIKCGKYPVNQLELMNCYFALLPFSNKNIDIELYTSDFVLDMLQIEDESWIKKPQSAKYLVEKLRNLILDSKFKLTLKKFPKYELSNFKSALQIAVQKLGNI